MHLTAARRILVSAPKESLVAYLRDISNVSRCDSKIRSVEVLSSDASFADVGLTGSLLAFPWRGIFRVEFTSDGGYRAWDADNPRSSSFSYRLRPVAGGTELTHEEQYRLPIPLWPFKPWVRQWLEGTIERELWVIKEGAEALNRRRQLADIDAHA